MKKIVALILALAVMMSALTAFGEAASSSASGEAAQTGQASNAFDEYDKKGYTHNSISTSGDGESLVMQICFNSPDRTDCVLVEAALTDEESAELEALDFFDENYWDNQWKLVIGLPSDRVTVTSLNDSIPSAEKLSTYVGKTVEDLQNDGYEWATDAQDDAGNDIMVFHNYDTRVMLAVTLAGNPEPEDLSDEEIGSQVIETIRFWGFDC